MSDRVASVILAAGASQRLGQPKQLIRVGGESLLRRTARSAIQAGCAPVWVVLGFAAEQMRPELQGLPVQSLTNAHWSQGMASSLRSGVSAAQVSADAVLLLVCDQVRLSSDHLRALLSHHRGGAAAITASEYGGRLGVPAIFSSRLFSELLRIEGDRGAREVIARHPAETQALSWPDGAFDLDSPEQLKAITAE
jgi:molybdenum cofactor cytidylyltransferase